MEKKIEKNGAIEKNTPEKEPLPAKTSKNGVLDDSELGGIAGGEGMTDGHIGG